MHALKPRHAVHGLASAGQSPTSVGLNSLDACGMSARATTAVRGRLEHQSVRRGRPALHPLPSLLAMIQMIAPPMRIPPRAASSAFPFRTSWRIVEAGGSAGASSNAVAPSTPDDVQDILNAIGCGGYVTRQAMSRWLSHPDERVTTHLAVRAHSFLYAHEYQWLVTRVLEETERDGIIWSQALDVIHSRLAEDSRGSWSLLTLAQVDALEARLAALQRWVRRHKWQASLPLFEFRSEGVYKTLVESAKALPEEWLVYACAIWPEAILNLGWRTSGFAASSRLTGLVLDNAPTLMAGCPTGYLNALAKLAGSRMMSVATCARVTSVLGIVDTEAATPALHVAMNQVVQQIAASLQAAGTARVEKREMMCLLLSPVDAIREAAMGLVSRIAEQPS